MSPTDKEGKSFATHLLKSWPEFFEPILTRQKMFELRLNDRRFQAGDVLVLKEWDQKEQLYTGREAYVEVTYLIDDKSGPGLLPGYVCMSIRPWSEIPAWVVL